MGKRGVNKVILLGRIGNCEIRYTQGGDAVANLSLATSETWKDKVTGEQKERTEWHTCIAYRGIAGVIRDYTKKGDQLYVEGALRTRKWTDKQGQERYTTEVQIEDIQLLGSKPQSKQQDWGQPQQPAPTQQKPTQHMTIYEREQAQQRQQQQQHQAADFDDMPF